MWVCVLTAHNSLSLWCLSQCLSPSNNSWQTSSSSANQGSAWQHPLITVDQVSVQLLRPHELKTDMWLFLHVSFLLCVFYVLWFTWRCDERTDVNISCLAPTLTRPLSKPAEAFISSMSCKCRWCVQGQSDRLSVMVCLRTVRKSHPELPGRCPSWWLRPWWTQDWRRAPVKRQIDVRLRDRRGRSSWQTSF